MAKLLSSTLKKSIKGGKRKCPACKRSCTCKGKCRCKAPCKKCKRSTRRKRSSRRKFRQGG